MPAQPDSVAILEESRAALRAALASQAVGISTAQERPAYRSSAARPTPEASLASPFWVDLLSAWLTGTGTETPGMAAMLKEIADARLRPFAQTKPLTFVTCGAVAGAIVMYIRPWRLINGTLVTQAMLSLLSRR